MPANYPEQLAERLRALDSAGRSVNKAAFLAAKADIASALAAGFVPKDIWRDLCGCQRVGFSYAPFLRLVKIHITALPVAHTPSPAPTTNAVVTERPNLLPAAINRPASPTPLTRGFVFNPIPNPDELF